MAELAQQARDYLERRKALLGEVPRDVQSLIAEGQVRLDALRRAIQQRDLQSARSAFRAALAVFEEIRLQLNEGIDAQSGVAPTPDQEAATVKLVLQRLRERWAELVRLASRNPAATIDTELQRIDAALRELEARSTTAAPETRRGELRVVRRDLQAVEAAIVGRLEAAP